MFVQECFTSTFGVLEFGKKWLLMTGCQHTSLMVCDVLCSVATEKEGMNSGLHCWRRHTPSQSAACILFLIVVDRSSGPVEQLVCVCACRLFVQMTTFKLNDFCRRYLTWCFTLMHPV